MSDQQTRTSQASDYREIHLDKGDTYDASLASSPLDSYMDRWEKYYLPKIIQRCRPGGIERYLDFACGTGRITEVLAPMARESFGVDISPTMLEQAKRKCPSTNFLQADLTESGTDLGTFDLVTSFRFFGNAQDELRIAALRAIRQRIRDDGLLILNNHRNPYSLAALLMRATGGQHDMDLMHSKLKRILHEQGFEIIFARAIGFWMFRSKLMRGSYSEATMERLFERLFCFSFFVPFAPNALIVARPIRN